MKSIVVYGSTTGNTETVAEHIAKALGAESIDVGSFDISSAQDYDLLVLGASTWGAGDVQDDWEPVLSALQELDLADTRVALFGLGDQEGYPDTFVDGMGTLYDAAIAAGATVIGKTSSEGYTFDESTALKDGAFVGLVIDEDTQSELTEERISSWAKTLT